MEFTERTEITGLKPDELAAVWVCDTLAEILATSNDGTGVNNSSFLLLVKLDHQALAWLTLKVLPQSE